jgi:hypothetical protein
MIHKLFFKLFLFWSVVASLLFAQQRQIGQYQPGIGQLPLAFEPNLGQGPAGTVFLAHGAYPVFLQPDKAVLIFPNHDIRSKKQSSEQPSAITLQLIGSNKTAQGEGTDLLPGKSNYYVGGTAENWRTGIPQFAAVAFRSVYPGIDLVYHSKGGQLEYDLVLSPGADPSLIRFQARGIDSMELDGSGDLTLRTHRETLELRKPAIYQKNADGSRRAVSGDFVVRDNVVSFRVGEYKKNQQLIVDPVLSYSTLIGANNSTTVSGVSADESGDMFITGTTFATNYPTVNPFQSKNNGTTNIFVTKLNPSGDVILYSTYIGGGAFDTASGIAVDPSGSAYITGTAASGNFPTTSGAFMTSCGEFCNTPFVSKFLSDGSIAFSTYMGGSNSPAHAIAVDSAGEAYIAGNTASNDLPTTPGSFEPVYPGQICTSCYNGYVEKLNSTGSGLVYSTYFGAVPTIGTPNTIGSGIAVDTAGSAYLVGSTTGVPTQNPIQASEVNGPFLPNAFIAKFSPDGSTLEYSTYLGGYSPFFSEEAGDFATSVAVDSSGNAHVAGTSSSCDFPLSLDALSTACVTTGFDQKIFALVVNSTGSQLLFSTFLASGNTPSIAVDAKGNSYVAGNTTSYQFPVLKPIESTSELSTSTTFVSELDLSGKLLFSTYYGSTYGAASAGIALDLKGGIYIAGEGQADFPLLNPISSQILQTTSYTIFASKISPTQAPQFSLAPRVSPIFALRNVSSSPLTIDSIVPSSNFTKGGNCGTSLAPGTGCTLILEGADDHRSTGTVTITTNASQKPETFGLSKSPNGDPNVGPLISASPATLLFGSQYIGSTSPSQTITLQNAGTEAATISGFTLGQPFNQTNDCPTTLNPSSFCTISVSYTPATSNDFNTLSIGINQGIPITIFVSGYGVSSSIALSTSSIQFGNQTVGAAGVGRVINLVNATSVPTTAPSISASAGFAQTNTCTGVLAPNATCRVSVSFIPSGNQNASGTLTATSYGPGGSPTVGLLATGLAAGDLEFAPVTLNFTGYVTGAQNGIITVTNNSKNSIPITLIKTAVPFSQTNTCPSSLSPAETCQVTVTWDPTQAGSSSGTLQVSYTGSGSPQTLGLSGSAQTLVQFYPTTVQFAPQLLNTSSPEFSVFVENYGSTTVNLSPVALQGTNFSIVQNACGSTLQRDTGCNIEVVFTPTATGLRTGTLSVTASDSSAPHTVTLQGTGVSSGTGSLSTASLDFGTQVVGTQSVPQSVTLSNTGSGPLGITSISTLPNFFAQTNKCGSSLAVGAKCTISIRFTPKLKGILVGSLTVQTDGGSSPQTVSLTGTGE